MFESLNIPSDLVPKDPRFASGPSLVPREHLEKIPALAPHLLGTSHRQGAIKNLVGETIQGLKKYFQVPEGYEVILGNGGATLLFDMISTGLVKERSVHYTCGEFSNKWYKAAKKVPWIKAKEVAVDFGKGIVAKDDGESDVIAMTLNETSTGVQLNSIPKVREEALCCVDATSGAGQVPCNIADTDVFFFSPQKVFASEGGLWVAIMSPKAMKRAQEVAAMEGRYIPVIFDWKQAIDNSVKNQTYNTPSILTIFLLNEQVKRMNEVGYAKVCEQAKEKANLIYNWASEKPYLSAFIEESEFRSQACATIDIDEKIDLKSLLGKLRKDKIVYDIEGYRKLGRNQVRIALFHNVTKDDLERLTKLLSYAIETVIK